MARTPTAAARIHRSSDVGCGMPSSHPADRYAVRNGLHVGFQIWGTGDVDILEFGSGTFISIDEATEQASWMRYSQRLAACGRLLRFDPSAIGLSDPPPDLDDLTFAGWAADALAVLDEAGSERAVLLATAGTTAAALEFATRYPERTASLVLVNGSARYGQDDDYPIGIEHTLLDGFRAGLDPRHAPQPEEDLSDIRLFAPSGTDDAGFVEWWSRAARRGAAPASAAALHAMTAEVDVRHLLDQVAVPTLVLHSTGSLAPGPAHGRFLADHIPGAHFTELPGADMVPFVGDIDQLADEIQEFITGDRLRVAQERVLTTLLFTDIVDSTGTAARLGDGPWSQLLQAHDALVLRQLGRFGGHRVKDTGDGMLATFDAPSRAIRCAQAIRLGVESLDLRIRAGLHAGEVERRGGDIGGIAVHVAARVAGSAGADEILVTRSMVDLVEGTGICFADRGRYVLKGVDRPRHLWSVTTERR